jgi:class 3 adenylate cyclase/HAMP domain-containing protein
LSLLSQVLRVACWELATMPLYVNLTPDQPRMLVLAVLCLAIAGYFLQIRDKTRDLQFLIGAFSFWTLHFLVAVFRESFLPVSGWSDVIEISAGLSGLVLFIGFAYQFRDHPYEREFRVSFFCACVLTVLCTAVLALQLLTIHRVNRAIGSGTSMAAFMWAETVLIRRWISAKKADEARAYRDFALVFLLSVAALGIHFLRDIGECAAAIASVISALLYLSTLGGFTLVYVNNSPKPTTFRVKVVGASLFAVLAVLMVIWTALVPSITPQSETRSALTPGINAAPHAENLGVVSPLQEKVLRCDCCILGSAVFVLVFFPAFFRTTLVEPLNSLLQAVEQLDVGSRDVHLSVRFNDEIGRLTAKFNDMARSLKTAEERVREYTQFLECRVHERTAELQHKNEENERLLLNILPPSIAERLKRGEGIIADSCSEVSIVFADIVGFTKLSADMPANELVELLSGLISDFDMLAEKHGVQKIKTIGDAYLAVAGLPEERADHAEAAVRLATDMLDAIRRRKTRDGRPLQLRIGINSGPVIAGVIGTHQFAYDLWGDTVNTASRMESSGEPGRIQVSEATFELLKKKYRFQARGEINIKGKGYMRTYFVAPTSVQSVVAGASFATGPVCAAAANDPETWQSRMCLPETEPLFTAA